MLTVKVNKREACAHHVLRVGRAHDVVRGGLVAVESVVAGLVEGALDGAPEQVPVYVVHRHLRRTCRGSPQTC